MLLAEKLCGSSYQSCQESVDNERWEDTLGEILGRMEDRGRLRGIGYGAPWKGISSRIAPACQVEEEIQESEQP
jgi:hypothetical protein